MGRLSDEHKLEILEHYRASRNMSKTAQYFSKKWNKQFDRQDIRTVLRKKAEDKLSDNEDDDNDEIEEIKNDNR